MSSNPKEQTGYDIFLPDKRHHIPTEFTPRKGKVIPLQSRVVGVSGEEIEYIYLVEAESYREAAEIFGNEHPLEREHCQHEYDCCGHWYHETPTFVCLRQPPPKECKGLWDGEFIVRQTKTLNV